MHHLFAAVGIALTLVAGPDLIGVTAIAQRPVTVRSGPGLEYSAISQLDPGQVVAVLGRGGDNTNWLRIRSQTNANIADGWIAHFTVTILGDPAQLPLVTTTATPAPHQTDEPAVQAQVFRNVNVRTAPTIEADILTQLRSGDRLDVVGRSGLDNDWLYVDLEGVNGWIAYFTVTVVGDPRGLPVINPLTGATITPTSIPEGVQAVAFRTVNVRSGPGVIFARVGQLNSGDVVPVIGRSDSDNNWLQIDLGDRTGWIAYFTVSVSGNPDTLPVIRQTPTPNS